MRLAVVALLAVATLALAACSGDEASGGAAGGSGAEAAAVPGSSALAAAGGITVTGTGSVTAVPDTAEFSFGVTSEAVTAAQAIDATSVAMDALLAALKAAGIDEADLQTQQVSVFPRFSDDGRSIVGYTASSFVSAVVREIDRAGDVIDAAVGAGANQISGPFLTIEDQDGLRNQALEAAMAQARAKAEAIAGAAGVSLGDIVGIVESGAAVLVPVAAAVEEAPAGARVPIEPGTQEVRATVTVTYGIS